MPDGHAIPRELSRTMFPPVRSGLGEHVSVFSRPSQPAFRACPPQPVRTRSEHQVSGAVANRTTLQFAQERFVSGMSSLQDWDLSGALEATVFADFLRWVPESLPDIKVYLAVHLIRHSPSSKQAETHRRRTAASWRGTHRSQQLPSHGAATSMLQEELLSSKDCGSQVSFNLLC